MSLKVAIFEDDKDLADLLKEMMEEKDFQVTNYYSMKDPSWTKADIVLADFRNKIVAFKSLVAECQKNGTPIIAISGAETGFKPQLLKPFSIDEMQAVILEQMMTGKKSKSAEEDEKFSLFYLFKKSS